MSKPAFLISSATLPQGHPSMMEYAKAAGPIFKAHGAEFLVAGIAEQSLEVLEGSLESNFSVAVE